MHYIKNGFLNEDIINRIVSFYPRDLNFRSETSYIMYDSIADYHIHKHFLYNIPFADYFFHCSYPIKYTSQKTYESSYNIYWKHLSVPYEFKSN